MFENASWIYYSCFDRRNKKYIIKCIEREFKNLITYDLPLTWFLIEWNVELLLAYQFQLVLLSSAHLTVDAEISLNNSYKLAWKIDNILQNLHFTWTRKLKIPLYENFMKGCMKSTWMKKVWTPEVKTLRKNAISWSKISKKCLKTPFLACFFKIWPAAQQVWSKWGQNSVSGELEKSTWSN